MEREKPRSSSAPPETSTITGIVRSRLLQTYVNRSIPNLPSQSVRMDYVEVYRRAYLPGLRKRSIYTYVNPGNSYEESGPEAAGPSRLPDRSPDILNEIQPDPVEEAIMDIDPENEPNVNDQHIAEGRNMSVNYIPQVNHVEDAFVWDGHDSEVSTDDGDTNSISSSNTDSNDSLPQYVNHVNMIIENEDEEENQIDDDEDDNYYPDAD